LDSEVEKEADKGIDRGLFAAGYIFLSVVDFVIRYFRFDISFLMLVYAVLGIFMCVLRLRNIGKSAWWCLLGLVPFVNIWLVYICFVQPPGYQKTKQLDSQSSTMRNVFITFFLAVILLSVHIAMRRLQR